MSSEAESIGRHMHGMIGIGVRMAVAAASMSSTARAQAEARRGRISASARAAEGRVYADSAVRLRERLADAEGDVEFFRTEAAQLQRKLDAVCAYASRLQDQLKKTA
ncbi:MAG TPA: hypothetical protein VMU82_06110 [Acetobacteraceae bacterium]|nr:hypothetical protein [Acetobacteraceae bacterium]